MPNPLSYLIDPIKNIMKPLYDTGVSLFGADSIRTPNSFNLNDFDISSYTDWQNNLSSSFGDAYSSVAMPNNNIQSILTQLGNVKDKNWESALTQAQQDLMNRGNTKSGREAFDKTVADIHKQQSDFRTGFGKDLMAASSAYSLMGLQQGEAAYNQTQLLDPLSKNNINAFTDAADTGFMANGGMVAKRTLTKADGGIAGGEFIQSEKGEVVMLPDGTIVKTGATKTHKKMKSEGDSDKITDALPEGSIVFPSDKKFTLKKKDFEGIAINVTTPEYKEGEKPQDPEITYFTDLFTKDKNTPAELILQLSKMIPVTQRGEGLINGDDPITNNTNAKNLQARMPWVEQVLSTFPKGQEILGGQSEGVNEGEETEQFAEGGIITEDMKKNAKASVSKYFDPTLNPTIAEIQKQNPAAFNRFVKDLKANPPKIVEFNSDKDNRLGYYEPAEQDKKTWKPKDGGTLYINTNKTLRDKTQESIEGTIAHELGHQGTWFNKALQVHNMQAAKKVYGDDMTKIANVDEDAAHVRMIKMNSGDIGKKNYSTKDVDRLIKEDSNDIRYLMKSLNNDKEKVATYLNELVVNSTKDNSTKYAKDGGMITEYKEGGIVGYEPKKAIAGLVIAGVLGAGSVLGNYLSSKQSERRQKAIIDASLKEQKGLLGLGFTANALGTLAQDTTLQGKDYTLENSYLNQLSTEIPNYIQDSAYNKILAENNAQTNAIFNNTADFNTAVAVLDNIGSKNIEAKSKLASDFALKGVEMKDRVTEAKYNQAAKESSEKADLFNAMTGNRNNAIANLAASTSNYTEGLGSLEANKANSYLGLEATKRQNDRDLFQGISSVGMNIAGSLAGASSQSTSASPMTRFSPMSPNMIPTNKNQFFSTPNDYSVVQPLGSYNYSENSIPTGQRLSQEDLLKLNELLAKLKQTDFTKFW